MPTVVPNLMPLAAAYAAHARSKDVVAPPVEEKLELPPAVVAPPVAPTATPPIRPALPEVRHTPPEVRPTPREVSNSASNLVKSGGVMEAWTNDRHFAILYTDSNFTEISSKRSSWELL